VARDRLNFKPENGMRASWSVCIRAAGRFQGVVKERGTGAWLWNCQRERIAQEQRS
jgi:hypothetical protein